MAFDSGPSESLRTIDARRKEVMRKETVGMQRSIESFSPYMTQVNTYKSRTAPLDQTRLMQDPRVQDWASGAGVRRSLATNITDGGSKINVNHIKYKRDADFTSTTPYDGGSKYNDEVCISNYVQERRDKNYKSGFHPKELRRNSRYDTEYGTRYRPSSSDYVARLSSTYNTTSRFQGLDRIGPTGLAEPVLPKRAADCSGEHVHYAKDGFGATPWMDHTAGHRRGDFWVGIAPPPQPDTVTHTTMRSETLEFQRRCPSEDPRSKILMGNMPLTHESDRTLRIREELITTNNFPRSWRTIYQTEHRDFSGTSSSRPATVR